MWPRSRKQLPSLRGPLPPRASLGDNSKEAVFFLLKRELGGDSHLFPGSSLLPYCHSSTLAPSTVGAEGAAGAGWENSEQTRLYMERVKEGSEPATEGVLGQPRDPGPHWASLPIC